MSFSPLASRKNACLFLAVFLCCFSISAFAQDKKAEDKPKPDVPFPGAKWVKGPNAADIGGIAEVKLNEGWVATDGNGARMMLEASQNLTSGKEIGLVGSSDLAWCVLFEFDEVGYVKDDEKNSLDAPKMMKSMQSSQEAANKELKKRGWPSMEIVGWQKEPLYNATTHNLEWGLRIKGEQSTQETINYNVRVLGRKGVMVVTLLVNPEKILLQTGQPLCRIRLWRQDCKIRAHRACSGRRGGTGCKGRPFQIPLEDHPGRGNSPCICWQKNS